jgi:phosphatidylserine decarboxylase
MNQTRRQGRKSESWAGLSRRNRTRRLRQRQEPKDHPVIKEFKAMIQKHPVEREYMETMISSIPRPKTGPPRHPKSLKQFFEQLNAVLTEAPKFNKTALVGTPMSAIMIWTMGSPQGFAAYRRIRINAMFGKVLAAYKKFLDSPASRYVLNTSPSGWFGPGASKRINMNEYVHDKSKPYYGFKSWNDFFARRIAPGARPIVSPEDNAIVNSACDSTIYRIHYNVKPQSRFWIKSEPYSLHAMLNGDEKYVDKFAGGAVYQAFLNPFNYHRWHSPVNGTIEKAYVVPGLYFTQVEGYGEDPTDQDRSEGYLTNVETRALIYIKSDNKRLGTVCVMPVGMVEISSCNIHKHIRPGHRVKKGDELGFFAYGGSTHCVIFQPNVVKRFFHKKGQFVKMGQPIAEVKG